jgi:hypothetical protein
VRRHERHAGETGQNDADDLALNSLVSYPLPIEFYDSGGMDGLRSRFKPEVQASAASDTEERRIGAGPDTNATVRERRTLGVTAFGVIDGNELLDDPAADLGESGAKLK